MTLSLRQLSMNIRRLQWGGKRSSGQFSRINMRHFCESNDRECKPRSSEFYEMNAINRHYFYFLDTRGQLFLEETMPRNIATCMKDTKFLDFTFKNLKLNDTEYHPDIPLISMCGKEINFISPADRFSVIGYKDFNQKRCTLIYGGTLEQEFVPSFLAYNPNTGRIYHRILKHRHLSDKYGLLHPHICQRLGDEICPDGDKYYLRWEGHEYSLETVDDNDYSE